MSGQHSSARPKVHAAKANAGTKQGHRSNRQETFIEKSFQLTVSCCLNKAEVRGTDLLPEVRSGQEEEGLPRNEARSMLSFLLVRQHGKEGKKERRFC
jgi:hypothetical protein